MTGHAVSEQQINSTHDPKNLNQSTDKAKDSDQYEDPRHVDGTGSRHGGRTPAGSRPPGPS
ncbi:hypothetical protein [Streptomyces cinnamoneus]|uniref:Uncharacterized protein n=1 Tax=Streptomyces cinnamoneus TaxID=53446 RepID=A0A918WEZ4_STRCJ|nr:hypothetical protein [Streptomyces cinnamoneus]GHC39257.1 hypothetical protein GCM10010507_11230 [Streptomyces cinnamoneus]